MSFTHQKHLHTGCPGIWSQVSTQFVSSTFWKRYLPYSLLVINNYDELDPPKQGAAMSDAPCLDPTIHWRLHTMSLSLLQYSSPSPISSVAAIRCSSSFRIRLSKSKYQTVILWLHILKGVDNCRVKNATVSHHPPWTHAGFSVWRGITLCAVISAWGPHQKVWKPFRRRWRQANFTSGFLLVDCT